jgi:negative regulator of flagellin synthesis FlgM
MTEKINNQGFRSVDATGTGRRVSRTDDSSHASSTDAEARTSGETVSLTSSAQLLQRLDEILASSPASDAKRIEAIKQAIDSGSYAIDARTIADRLIRLERDLG